jgi:addiction module RelE/StbE family toxin
MQVNFKPKFVKQYNKLSHKMQKQFDERLELFIEDPTTYLLNVHSLKGKYAGFWSINISGDLRAIYTYEGDTIIVFMLIGTHSQLYG